MSARSAPKADAEGSDLSSSTLRELTAASNEVHMLATLTAAMMEAQNTDLKDDTRRRSGPGAESTSTSGTAVVSEPSVERSQRRRSSSRSRLRPTSNATITAAAGALLDRMRSSGQQANARSGIQITTSRLPQRLPVTESPGSVTSTGMSSLRRHVEDLSTQLKLARAKQETDAKVIQDLRDENARLKHLLESASEVSDAAATSLRELARSRRTCEDLRQQLDSQQRRAQDAEAHREQLQQLLRDAEVRASEMEQRANSARAQLAERTCARSEQEVATEKLQSAERRAARAEQIAAQEQARAADAVQRAHRAEAAAAEDHDRALDAERRAARAEHLLEQLQEQALELERQVAHAEQQVAVEVNKLAEAERRASRAEQTAAAEKERAAGAERRVIRAEEEAEQARTLAAAADRRVTVIEEAAEEERARADAADRRAARAEQAAEEARQLLHEAERRIVRASQLQEEAERRAARLEQIQEKAVVKLEEAERRAARAVQASETAEKRALEAERRAARAEQAQQDSTTRAAESDRRAARAEQTRDEAVAEAERRAARAEQAAEEARAHAVEMERRALRAEAAAQQDRQVAAEAERQAARLEQALEQAQASYVAMEKRAMRAEQAAEEARSRAEEARVLVGQAEARAARAEQATAHERERAQEEARHAARMEAAAIQDQERAREADDRAAAALARAQQAETRMAVAEGHTAALELRLQQALAYADAADARAVDAERRYDRLASESRDLHAAVVLATQPEPSSPRALLSRTAQSIDRDRSPRRLHVRRAPDDEIIEQQVNSPRHPRLSEGGTFGRAESLMNGTGDTAGTSSPLSTPVASVVGVFNSRVRLWADAYSTPPEQGPAESAARKMLEDGHAVRAFGPARGNGGTGMGSCRMSVSNPDDAPGPVSHPCSPRRPDAAADSTWGSSKTGQQYLEVYLDGNPVLADQLRHVRAELRSTRHELGDVKSRYQSACTRVQQLEEEAASVEQMQAKLEKLAVQARKSEQLAAELRICRSQLQDVEGLQLELRKAQAESASAQGLRMALEEARAQLVEIDRVRSEARRLNASLQTVTRERDSARNELAEASAQLVGMATLRAQLQRTEAAVSDAEQSREEARAAAAAATVQMEKLRTQLSIAEEELAETVKRCARVQATADEAAHQRDRLQLALAGAEGALQAAEEERIVLAAEQERLRGKAQELVEAQEELRMLRSQLQEAATTQRRAVQAEEQAQARAEEAQEHVSALKAQLAEGQSDLIALQHQLQKALGQMQEMKNSLDDAGFHLEEITRLRAQLAAAADRAEKAESQLRNCKEDLSRNHDEVERLQKELAQVRRELAKSQEETANAAALANSRGARATELEHEVAVLREKSYQLEVEVASMTTELNRLKTDLASASDMIDEASNARNQLLEQLSEAAKQQARAASSASAAEDRMKADMQQLQVRLAATEAELRTLQHNNGSLHDDLERARTEILSLQGMLQEEIRRKDDCSGECRRLQRDLELLTESLAQAQRAQRGAAAGASELESEVDRLRGGRAVMEAELQANAARIQRLQEDVRQLTERNNELASQAHGLSSTIRQLEADNARLSDGHAKLTVQLEARAAEVRASRGEAAELAADRARLLADLHDVRTEVEHAEAERAELLTRIHGSSFEVSRSRGADPRITITGGGIPPISDASGPKPGSYAEPASRVAMPTVVPEDPLSIVPSPNGNLQALLANPLDTGALLAGTADLSHYEALLTALDEEAQHLDEELTGKEASSSALLQRMRATKRAITARMDALQAALHSARDAESEMRRRAADKELTIHRLQQQLAQMSGSARAPGVAGVAPGAGLSGPTSPVGFGADAQQGNAVILTLRHDLDAAHERLRDAGRQLREAQQRAQTAEAEAGQLRDALADAQSDVARLQNELTDNDRVLSDAESALLSLVSEKDAIEHQLEAAKLAERAAVEAAEGLRRQVASLQSQLDAALETATTAAPLGTEPSGGMAGAVYDRMINYLQSLDAGDPPAHSSDGGPDHTLTAAHTAPVGQIGTAAAHHQHGIASTTDAAGAALRPANRRYPLGSRTSESDSTLSAFRNGVNQADWDAVSASGWDNSAAGSMGGRAATVPGVFLFSSAGTGVTADTSYSEAAPQKHRLSDMSVAHTDNGSISASLGNCKAAEQMETAPGGLGAPHPGLQSPSLSTRKMWGIGLRSFDGEGDRAKTCAPAPRTISVPTITPNLRNSASGSSVAGLVMKARASAAAGSRTAATASSMGLGGAVSPTGLVSPVSPLSSTGYHMALDRSVSGMHQSLDCLVGELGVRQQQDTSSGKPSSSSLSTITTSTEDAPAVTGAAVELNENASKADCGPDGASTSTKELPTSDLLMRTSPTSSAITPRLLAHQSFSATISTSIVDAEAPGVPSLGKSTSTRTPVRASELRGPVVNARQAAVADAEAALQSASRRLSLRSVAVRLSGVDDLNGSPDGVDQGVSGGSGSPVMSPRHMLQGRSLSRGLLQVTNGLSSPRTPCTPATLGNPITDQESTGANRKEHQAASKGVGDFASLAPPVQESLVRSASSQPAMSLTQADNTKPAAATPLSQKRHMSAFQSSSASSIAAAAAGTREALLNTEDHSYALVADKQSLSFGQQPRHTSLSGTAVVDGSDHVLLGPGKLPAAEARAGATPSSGPLPSTSLGSASRSLGSQTAGDDDFVRRKRGSALRSMWTKSADSPEPHRLFVGVATGGKRLTASQPVTSLEDGESFLAKRLAAMDEALRAIGAV